MKAWKEKFNRRRAFDMCAFEKSIRCASSGTKWNGKKRREKESAAISGMSELQAVCSLSAI